MKRPLVIYRDGIRYWASKQKLGSRTKFNFWSSADWPFHHGSYTPDKVDAKDVRVKFMEWIP